MFSVAAARDILGSGVLDGDRRRDLMGYVAVGLRGADPGEPLGEVSVCYSLPHQHRIGRFRAAREEDGARYSLGTMPNDVRAWLAHDLYWDVDIANCQPSLAAQMMRQAGVPAPALHHYVAHRDTVLLETAESTGVDRAAAKKLFLAVCYGGSWETWARERAVGPSDVPDVVKCLQAELRDASRALLAVHPDGPRAELEQRRANPDAHNPSASRFAYLTQDAERRCLEALVDAAVAHGRQVGALIHDGFLLRKRDGEEDIASLLCNLKAAVAAATGFVVRLEVKPWLVNPIYAAAAAMSCVRADGTPPTHGILDARHTPADSAASLHNLTEAESVSVKDAIGIRDHPCCSWSAEDLHRKKRWRMRAVGCSECLVHPEASHDTWTGCGMLVCGEEPGVTLVCDVSGDRRVLQGPQRDAVIRAFGGLWGRRDDALMQDDPEDFKPTTLAKLLHAVLEHAEDGCLKRRGGYVWRPVPGCPCAYQQVEECRDLLNAVLGDDPRYKWGPPRLQRELLEYLRNYNPKEFPDVVRDLGLLSFSDGVLVISDASFVPYDDALPVSMQGRVARHHINAPYQDRPSIETPLWDTVLSAQMNAQVAGTLETLIGRLLFAVGERDRWQVMPYLVGDAGTGKSLVLEIVTAMFAPSSTASLSGTQEATFGLEGKWDKELIIGRDMPRSLRRVLEASLLQSMVTGEGVSVAQKGKEALDIKAWRVPMIMASNFMPDYVDSAGQISRRIVTFAFRGEVRHPDTTLVDRMLRDELPAIVRKVLAAYLEASDRHGAQGFISWCPPELRDARRAVQLETDYVRRFLTAGPEDNEIYVVQRAGRTTTLTEFKEAFRKYMRFKHRGVPWRFDDDDRKPFLELGYMIDRLHLCKSCGRKAVGGGEGRRCCPDYAIANRVQRVSIVGMEVVYGGGYDHPMVLHGMANDPLECRV